MTSQSTSKRSTQDRLVVALGLALEEIHHPGAANAIGLDITAMIEGVIKEATRQNGVSLMIREEIVRRAQSAA
jgi:hypothetical protein